MAKDVKDNGSITIARNKKAYHDYFVEENIEAGIMLKGTEVKALRLGGSSIKESHVGEMEGALYLFNAHIPEYGKAGRFLQHELRRPRKLLLHKKELNKLIGSIQKKGVTIMPTALYFNRKGLVKLSIGVAKGKKQHDKREVEKNRDWQRDKARIVKENN